MPLTLVENPETFAPNEGGQAAFMDDWENRYVALAGGWFAGKTWAGARKLLLLHLWNAFDDSGRKTGVDGLVIAQTYSLARTVNVKEIRLACDEIGLPYRFRNDPQYFCFEFPTLHSPSDESLIMVRSADRPDLINSFTIGHAWGDEAARWKSSPRDQEGNPTDPLSDPFLQATGRLRDPRARFQQFLLTFTHEGDGTWVYEDFESNPKPSHKLYRAGTIENPDAADFVTNQRKLLSGSLAAQYLEGIAANFKGGNVYDNYDETLNADNTLGWDFNRPLQVGFDFNNTPGSHAEAGQWFPDKRLVTTVQEHYEDKAHGRRLAQLVARWICREFRADGAWRFPGKVELFGDASGKNPNEANGAVAWDEVAAEFTAAGIPYTLVNVPSANPHVADRVAAMNCAFRNAEGQIRYKVNAKNCPKLVRDFRTLKWAGNEIDKDDRKLSHASDADSYRTYQLLPVRRIAPATNRVAYASA